jgi:hypothetical protein
MFFFIACGVGFFSSPLGGSGIPRVFWSAWQALCRFSRLAILKELEAGKFKKPRKSLSKLMEFD